VVREKRHERRAHALEREVDVAVREVHVCEPNVRAMGKIRGRICARFKSRTEIEITFRQLVFQHGWPR
jgi:hypothetical protein